MIAAKKKAGPRGQGQPDMVREVSSATWHLLGEEDRTKCGRVIGGQVEQQSFTRDLPKNTHVCKTCERVKGEAS